MATGGSSSTRKPSDLSSSQNKGSDFSSSKNKGSDFSLSQIKGSDFSSTQDNGSDFSSSQNKESDFSSSQNKGSDFSSSKNKGLYFSSSQNKGSDFRSSQNKGSDFSSSQNKGSDFSSSQNKGSDFSSSQNKGSDFSSSQNKGSDFSSSQNKGSYFSSPKKKGSNWHKVSTVSNRATLDTAEQCQNHKENKLELFCEDHDMLICSRCLLNSHKKCTERVVHIDEKVKEMQETGVFTNLTEKINELKQELTQKKEDLDGNVERLQMAFEEQLDKINTLRKKLNETLDQLESNTTKELNTLLGTLKAPLQDDIEKCIEALSRIENIQDEIQKIDKNTETLKLILYRKCLEKSSEIESMKSQIVSNSIPTIQFIPDSSIKDTFSLSSLGTLINPNEILKVSKVTRYDIPRAGIFSVYIVSAICETATGALLITHVHNEEVMLVDQDFKLVTYYKLPSKPMSMYSIGASVVAVALDNSEIHFIRVTNVGQLEPDRKMKLEHECRSIAHHQDNLYITSHTALYHYTVCGRLVGKIYEVLPIGGCTCRWCSTSPDGTQLYVANGKKLVTLSRDGTVINVLCFVSELRGLCVTDSGQVLVSVYNDGSEILQVDKDGKQILAVVQNGVKSPIYYSKHRVALIGGVTDDYLNLIHGLPTMRLLKSPYLSVIMVV